MNSPLLPIFLTFLLCTDSGLPVKHSIALVGRGATKAARINNWATQRLLAIFVGDKSCNWYSHEKTQTCSTSHQDHDPYSNARTWRGATDKAKTNSWARKRHHYCRWIIAQELFAPTPLTAFAFLWSRAHWSADSAATAVADQEVDSRTKLISRQSKLDMALLL